MKLTILLLVAAGLSAGAIPSDAAEKPAAAAKCFAAKDIQSHKVGDGRTLYFKVGGATYKAEMTNNCLAAVGPTDTVKLDQAAGSASVCAPTDLAIGIELSGGGLPAHCRIDTMTRLTASQAGALPKASQP